jgi:hypothetical protein
MGIATVKQDIYVIFRRLRDAFRRSAMKSGNQELVSHSRQCSSTPLGFGEVYLSKKQRDNAGDSSYFPDLAPADFYVFPQPKSGLNEGDFVMLPT